MCTYATEQVAVEGRARTHDGWGRLQRATVYFDHPVSFPAAHSLNIDLFSDDGGALRRLSALELDPHSARALAHAILHLLDTTPAVLLEDGGAATSARAPSRPSMKPSSLEP